MTVKLSRDSGTPIKHPSLHSFLERSRDPGTINTTQTLISINVHISIGLDAMNLLL